MLLVGFAIHDVDRLSETGRLTLPVMPERSRWEILTMVAGTLIVVQGFETRRYLGHRFYTLTRIRACLERTAGRIQLHRPKVAVGTSR